MDLHSLPRTLRSSLSTSNQSDGYTNGLLNATEAVGHWVILESSSTSTSPRSARALIVVCHTSVPHHLPSNPMPVNVFSRLARTLICPYRPTNTTESISSPYHQPHIHLSLKVMLQKFPYHKESRTRDWASDSCWL